MMKSPGRYKLHQYLKYAHQWASTITYKCRLYLILESWSVSRCLKAEDMTDFLQSSATIALQWASA